MRAEAERHAVCCELVYEVACAAGEVTLKAAGASMIPAIWPGDILTVRRCEVSSLRPGQIILFRRVGKLIAHRIQTVDNDHLVTRGDSLRDFDPPVMESEVIGRVARIVRDNRTVEPALTIWKSMASYLLRQSDLLLRGTLFFSRRLCRSWEMQPSFCFAPRARETPR
jgi:signal peptidase I